MLPCHIRTAKKAWNYGWPDFAWARPIHELLGQPQCFNAPIPPDKPEAPSTDSPPDSASGNIKHGASEAGAAGPSVSTQRTAPSVGTHLGTDARQTPTHSASTDGTNHAYVAQTNVTTAVSPAMMKAQPDALEVTLATLAQGAAAALTREDAILTASRNNILGIEALANAVLRALDKKAPLLLARLVQDLESRETTTVKTFVESLQLVSKLLADNASRSQKVMEMQRLMVGMPTQITETRTKGPADEGEGHSRLASLLGSLARAAGPRMPARYEGEEGSAEGGADEPAVIDVEASPAGEPDKAESDP